MWRANASLVTSNAGTFATAPVPSSSWIFQREPDRVIALVERDPQFGVDRLTSALMQFGAGQATFSSAGQLVPYQRVHLFGTRARLEVEIPFNAAGVYEIMIEATSKDGTLAITDIVIDVPWLAVNLYILVFAAIALILITIAYVIYTLRRSRRSEEDER